MNCTKVGNSPQSNETVGRSEIVPSGLEDSLKAITSLANESLFSGKSADALIEDFASRVKMFDGTLDSQTYGTILSEMEQMILRVKEVAPEKKSDLQKMEAEFKTFFQLVPPGPGQITQLEVDHLVKMTQPRMGGICKNQFGTPFKMPEISPANLTSFFIQNHVHKVMYSLKVDQFEGVNEVCDLIMLGERKTNVFEKAMWRVVNLLNEKPVTALKEQQRELKDLLQEKTFIKKAGYASYRVGFIKNLQDQEKAKRLIEQGFVLYVLLIYPSAVTIPSIKKNDGNDL